LTTFLPGGQLLFCAWAHFAKVNTRACARVFPSVLQLPLFTFQGTSRRPSRPRDWFKRDDSSVSRFPLHRPVRLSTSGALRWSP